MTPAELADSIGCSTSAVHGAIRRLNIRRKRGAPLTDSQADRLRAAITPGRGQAGGYPAGRRRHDTLTDRQIAGLMRRVIRRIERQSDLSLTRVAAEIGVSTRTLCRWRDGIDHPSPERLVKLQQWLDAAQA